MIEDIINNKKDVERTNSILFSLFQDFKNLKEENKKLILEEIKKSYRIFRISTK